MARSFAMIGLVKRLQSYLREKAHFEGRERVSIPPFTLFYNPSTDNPQEGIAIPDEAATYPPELVRQLCAAFNERGRVPCIQYLDAFAPGLTITLQLYPLPLAPSPLHGEGEENQKLKTGNGALFVQTLRLPVMYCTAGMLAHPTDVPGLVITMAGSDAPLEEIKAGWNVNSQGFDSPPVLATDVIAAEFRRTLVTSRSFVARFDGVPVAAGMFEVIRDGLTELVGITTLEPYRRRGIGAALTADMTRAAFDSGVEIVFLIAANESAGRVYERLGFLTAANLVEYQHKAK